MELLPALDDGVALEKRCAAYPLFVDLGKHGERGKDSGSVYVHIVYRVSKTYFDTISNV